MKWAGDWFNRMFPNYYNKNWHAHFAWYPVKTKEKVWVWLETVERRYDGETIDYYDVWNYRLIQTIKSN